MTLGVFLMAVILFVLFRRASGVLLPVAMVLLSLAVNYGIMALLGIPTSMSGQVLPVLVLMLPVLLLVLVMLLPSEVATDASSSFYQDQVVFSFVLPKLLEVAFLQLNFYDLMFYGLIYD